MATTTLPHRPPVGIASASGAGAPSASASDTASPSASTSKNAAAASYEARAQRAATSNPLRAYLFRLMHAKRTNLCVSADVHSTAALLRLAEDVGDQICILKTHADIVDDFSPRTIQGLRRIAARRGFLIFEDRKFGDIGNTVQAQYIRGPLAIASWAHLVNAHIFPGPAVVTALHAAAQRSAQFLQHSVLTEIGTGTPEAVSEDEDAVTELSGPSHGHSRSVSSNHGLFRTSHSASGENGVPPSPTSLRGPEGRKASVVATTIIEQTIEIPERDAGMMGPLSPNGVGGFHINPVVAELGLPPSDRGLLLLAQMSSDGNLMDAQYTQKCIDTARQHANFVLGFIAQENLNNFPADSSSSTQSSTSAPHVSSQNTAASSKGTSPSGASSSQDDFVIMTPGVNLPPATGDGGARVEGDSLGQRYRTPTDVITHDGCDIVIVGRGILAAPDRAAAAARYREEAWKAYEARVGS